MPKKKPGDAYFRSDSDPDMSVYDQIRSDVRTALEKIRSKLEPNNYKELECLADSVREQYEELIIEKWRLLGRAI